MVRLRRCLDLMQELKAQGCLPNARLTCDENQLSPSSQHRLEPLIQLGKRQFSSYQLSGCKIGGIVRWPRNTLDYLCDKTVAAASQCFNESRFSRIVSECCS